MIKFINFIRLNVLIIALFGNETIFGMMLSTNQKYKNIKPTLDKNIWSALDSEILYYNVLLPYCGRQARLVCKAFAQYDSILSTLYSTYVSQGKKTLPICVFLDCVNKKEHAKAKWFLDNKQDEPLFYVSGLYNYSVLNPYTIAQNNNDVPMMKLLKDYKDYNVYVKIKKIQKSIGHTGTVIKSLSRPTIKLSEADISTLNSFTIDINYPLCLAACMGDKELFKSEIQKCVDNRTLEQVLHSNIPLIMWIAIKNRDLSFILYLLNDSSVKESFNKYMQDKQNNLNLLWFMSLNVPLEWYYHAPSPCANYIRCIESDKVVLTQKHIDGVEKIIEMGIFTSMSPLLELFKDKNEGIKQIYEIFNKELDRQDKEKKNWIIKSQEMNQKWATLSFLDEEINDEEINEDNCFMQ